MELLKYAITSSSMRFVVYYIRKYSIQIAKFKTALIWELLYNLEAFIKSLNQNFSYQKSIDNEIGIYLVEMLIPSFTFKQARLLWNMINLIFDRETALVAPLSQDKKQNILEKMDHDSDNRLYLHSFVTFNYNPLKPTVLILCAMVRVKNLHPNLDFDPLIDEWNRLALDIIEFTDNIEEVRYMLYDYWLNGHKVIDMIGYYNLGSIIACPKVSIVINNLWSSPYVLYDFHDRSYVVASFKSVIFWESENRLEDEKDIPNQVLDNFKSPHNILKQYKPDKDLYRSHMFTYNVWKKSIFTYFVTEWVIVIVIALYFQLEMASFLDQSNKMTDINTQIAALQSQLNGSWPLSSDPNNLWSQIAQLSIEFQGKS